MTGRLVAAALRLCRKKFRRVAGAAFVVFGGVAAIDTLALVLVADHHVSRPWGAALASGISAVIAMAGVVFYAGLLDLLVGAHHQGQPDPTLGQALTRLPLGRLAGADVVLAAATLAGLALGVVPGVVAFTLGALVGPVIIIEDHPIGAAFHRSAQLARGCFWTVLCLVTLPVELEQAVLHAIHYDSLFRHPVVAAFLLNGLLGATIGSLVGLLEVVLAHELIAGSPLPGGSGEAAIGHRGAWEQ
jgi:hypothetical protein